MKETKIEERISIKFYWSLMNKSSVTNLKMIVDL